MTTAARERTKEDAAFRAALNAERREQGLPAFTATRRDPRIAASGLTRAGVYSTIDALDFGILNEHGTRIHILMKLAMDYVGTVMDLAVILRRPETKKLSRQMRALIADQERYFSRFIDKDHNGFWERMSLKFEESIGDHLDRLAMSLGNETARFGLERENRNLVIAVQQAMTLYDAISIAAERFDDELTAMGIPTTRHSIVEPIFERIMTLLPEFAGNCYRPRSEARQLTARIIARLVRNIKVRKTENPQDPERSWVLYYDDGKTD